MKSIDWYPYNFLIMKDDINTITINNESSELIVKICFLVTDLNHQFETEEIKRFKNALSGSKTIQRNLDNMLDSDGLKQFLENLFKSKNKIEELLNLYKVLPLEISNKKEIKETLTHLDNALENLKSSISTPQN